MRKPDFAYAKTKAQISCAVTAQLISAFVFATRIVQFLYFLNPKFPVTSHLLCLYRPVCVGPGRKPRRPVFSRHGSNYMVAVVSLIGKLSQIGNFKPCIWGKRYFLPLGTAPKTAVGFIAKNITVMNQKQGLTD